VIEHGNNAGRYNLAGPDFDGSLDIFEASPDSGRVGGAALQFIFERIDELLQPLGINTLMFQRGDMGLKLPQKIIHALQGRFVHTHLTHRGCAALNRHRQLFYSRRAPDNKQMASRATGTDLI
jgi:hypothetical protein